MDLNNLGIFYKASYLVQGNRIERCNTSKKLNVKNTFLKIRNDGKDSDIESIRKHYNGNLYFHLPSINPDLSNLNSVNNLVKEIKNNNIELVSIDASNLSFELFEWSTVEEQKKYFLNIVTSIATIVSNKIQVVIENVKYSKNNTKFGSKISELTDLLAYVNKLLIKDFGFKDEDVKKYLGISLNCGNLGTESIDNFIEVFENNIKIIKVTKQTNIDSIIRFVKGKKNIKIFLETSSDLDDIKDEYKLFEEKIVKYLKDTGEVINNTSIEKNNNGFSNILMVSIVVLTIVIVILMFIVKLR